MAYEHILLNAQALTDALGDLSPKARHLALELHLAAWRTARRDRLSLATIRNQVRSLKLGAAEPLVDEIIAAGLAVREDDHLVLPSLTAERDRQAKKIAHNARIAPKGVAARRAKAVAAPAPPDAVHEPAGARDATHRVTQRVTQRVTHTDTQPVTRTVTLGGSTSSFSPRSVPELGGEKEEVQPSGMHAGAAPGPLRSAHAPILGGWRAAFDDSAPAQPVPSPRALDDLGRFDDELPSPMERVA